MGSLKIDFRIAYDKLKHLELGTYIVVLGIVFIVFTGLWSWHLWIPTSLYSAAVGRELYNRYIEKTEDEVKGIFDWNDVFATTSLGGFIYFLFLVAMHFTDKL